MKIENNRLITSCLTALLFVFLLSSCQEDTQTITRYGFDAINLDYQPKNGLDSLKTYLPLVDEMSKDERMAFDLRYNLSRGKNFLPLPSDSIVKNTIAYFESRQDTKRVLEGYLLLSYVYFDLNDYAQVDESVQKGIETPHAERYPKQLAHLYSTQGVIFRKSAFDSLALASFKRAHNLYLRAQDTIMLSDSYKDLGIVKSKLHLPLDSTLTYYYKALERARLNKDGARFRAMQNSIAYMYLRNDDVEKASEILNQSSSGAGFQHLPKYSVLSKYYKKKGDFEMMRTYCDSMLQLETPQAMTSAHYKLFYGYEEQGDYKKAYHHLHEFTYWNDSIKRDKRATKLFQIESKYQNKLLRSKNELLASKQTATMRGIWALVLVFLIISVGAYMWYRYYIGRITALARKKERRQKNLYTRSLGHIENMKQEIEVLQSQIQSQPEVSEDTKHEEVIDQQKLLEVKIQKAELERAARVELEKELRKMDVFIKMINIANGGVLEKLSEDEWHQLERGFEQTYDNLLFTLREVGRINKSEERLCCLVKLDIHNKGISVLLDKAPTTVSTMKQRVYKKITDKNGTASDFYEFIAGL